MSPLRVARIPYLNSAPFYRSLSPAPAAGAGSGEEPGADSAGIELIDLPPHQLGVAARSGYVDAGIVSMCDGFRSPEFEPLLGIAGGMASVHGLGVASDGPSHSVLLLSRVRPEELHGASIAVTGETSTSYPLLRLLLERRYGVRAQTFKRVAGDEENEMRRTTHAAALVIGDRALRMAAAGGIEPGALDYNEELLELPSFDANNSSGSTQPFRFVVDLATVWRRWQELPFVFAQWMVRRELDSESRGRLLKMLDSSLDTSLRDLEGLAAAHAAPAGLTPRGAYHYLMGFTYRIGEREQQGITRFRELLEAAPWWDSALPEVVRASPEAPVR